MRAHAADAVSHVEAQLGEADFERLRAQGAAASTADVVSLMIDVLDAAPAAADVRGSGD
jgi:hypothetical protein